MTSLAPVPVFGSRPSLLRPRAAARLLATLAAVCGLAVDLSAQSLDPKEALARLAARRAELREKLPPPPSEARTGTTRHDAMAMAAGLRAGEGPMRERMPCACPTHHGNPLSSLLVREENPEAARLEGFVARDDRGRHTRPWRARTREECRRRGGVVQRPLLVFLETPPEQVDFDQPWLGPVRFDRPGFFTTKERITEQIFGRGFDFRDPDSMAGFYFRESGGQLIIRGDATSVHTVTVPFIDFHADALASHILAQLDPIVDFTQRADEFGWAHPVIVVTPFSTVFDIYDAALMGGSPSYIGFASPVFYSGQYITDDSYPDGTSAALSMIAVMNIAMSWGWNHVPGDPWFGLPDELFTNDQLYLYSHEYGHALGFDHMFTWDYTLDLVAPADPILPFARVYPPFAFNRTAGTGFVTSVMNYSPGTGFFFALIPSTEPIWAGLDPINRSKLDWGHVTEVTLTDERRPGRDGLAPGDKRRIHLVEHLGESPRDPRPQILKVNLPPEEVALFPRTDASGNPTGYWPPAGGRNRRMAWSGTTWGGSRTMETTLHIPKDLAAPVLSFWTKYGSHSSYRRPAGWAFGWVQISTDGGATWTSLAGRTSQTFVASWRPGYTWTGDDLGSPAFTGDSRAHAADGWIFEQIPLPVPPGTACLLRFNHSGYPWTNTFTPQDTGWWIDDIHLGDASRPTRHLVSDFEGRDAERWRGLLDDFDQGFGFVVVEETAAFPHAYLFELRGSNAHDAVAYQQHHPRVQNSFIDLADYTCAPGVTGYYTNHYASYWAQPFRYTGTATGRNAPIDQLRQFHWSHPLLPGGSQDLTWDFSFRLEVALDPSNPFGYTLADLAFDTSTPSERFTTEFPDTGLAYVTESVFPVPSPVTLLDAAPTYRPADILPSTPHWLLPELGPFFSPALGAVGGWPKSLWHGPLGLHDPTTTQSLGQPFLMHDAAFHPARNARFDDAIDYRGRFAGEFSAHHAGPTLAALGSPTLSERYAFVPTVRVPVSDTEYIQRYRLFFQPQDAAGLVVPAAQAVRRPWIEQLLYERLVNLVYLTLVDVSRAPPPAELTLATKPGWEAFYDNLFAAADRAHQIANTMIEHARHLGDNPDYAALNAFGDQGALSPGYWTAFYLEAWTRAKGPAPLPSYDLSIEVEKITTGRTPIAQLEIRRTGRKHTPGYLFRP